VSLANAISFLGAIFENVHLRPTECFHNGRKHFCALNLGLPYQNLVIIGNQVNLVQLNLCAYCVWKQIYDELASNCCFVLV